MAKKKKLMTTQQEVNATAITDAWHQQVQKSWQDQFVQAKEAASQ